MKKRFLALVVAFGAGSCVAANAAPTHDAKMTKAQQAHAEKVRAAMEAAKLAKQKKAMADLAPADEYFGPLKESMIGIKNTIHDLYLRYHYNHDIADQTYRSALLTERAVRDWGQRYPHDGQVPREIYFLQRLYTDILTQQSRQHAAQVAAWMFKDFGSSPQARQLRKTLAVEHLQPLPTPAPAALSPDGTGASDTSSAPAAAGTSPASLASAAPSPAGAAASAPASGAPDAATSAAPSPANASTAAASPIPAGSPSASAAPSDAPSAAPSATGLPTATPKP